MGIEQLGEHTIRDLRRRDSQPDLTPRSYSLLLLNDAGIQVVSLPASGAVVVGRGPGADVRIADERMSRRHARIHVDGGFRIEDLHSANGTSVGGVWLGSGEARAFKPGEAVRVGRTTLLIRGHASNAPLTQLSTSVRSAAIATDSVTPDGGSNRAMKTVLALADRAACSMLTVLLLGETGVGKDVLAERIHRASPRANGPFLRLNCAAFSPALLASELFGHEKGAYTGATSAQPGLLQSASGGTVFFDEVGELPLDLQAKLLIVLDRREVLPVGAVRPRQIDVRFISATNRKLPHEVEAGTFRRDLYHRLNGLTLELPPLRERVAEIDDLARRFAAEAARSLGQAPPAMCNTVLEALRSYSWPGNIRELRAVIDRAVLLGTGGVVHVHDLLLAGGTPLVAAGAKDPGQFIDDSCDPERQQTVEALAQCGGNQSRAAKMLGVARNTLIARIKRYGLARPLSGTGRT